VTRLLATLLAVLLGVTFVLSGCAASPGLPADAPARTVAETTPVVTGYAMEGSATPASITRDGDLLDTIGVDGVTLLSGGGRISRVSADARALRSAASAAGRKPVLLLSNYSNRINDFDEPLAHRMLTSRTHRRAAVAALVHRAAGFSGVQIDLESLSKRDTKGLVWFTRAVRRALPRSKTVSMAFMASTDARGYAARGYDLRQLAKVLDVAVLMSYDQHGPWSRSGPIGALPWVRSELRYFLSRVPASKVDLGAAAYGYRWGGGGTELTVPQARRLAGSRARWSSTYGEWHARLAHGRKIWWDDARSVELRRKLATAQGLHGLAIWQIGSSGRLTP
jgi:spore germination protein